MSWTFRRAMPVWWSFLWRTALYGVLAGLLFRIGAYVSSFVWKTDMKEGMLIASIAAALSYFPISLVALKQGLSKGASLSED